MASGGNKSDFEVEVEVEKNSSLSRLISQARRDWQWARRHLHIRPVGWVAPKRETCVSHVPSALLFVYIVITFLAFYSICTRLPQRNRTPKPNPNPNRTSAWPKLWKYNSRVKKKKKYTINVITLIIMPLTRFLSLSLHCRCLCTPKSSSALAAGSSRGSRCSSPTCPTRCWIMHATWQSNYIIAWGVICSCICISPRAGWCSARLHSYQVSERDGERDGDGERGRARRLPAGLKVLQQKLFY